ncbi:hypothetical protein ABW19_dt0203557 [Dactylella cylindrospora]|nr:hypothetical protein ABW19_dt0203557 [Dactylella cylindrospora]
MAAAEDYEYIHTDDEGYPFVMHDPNNSPRYPPYASRGIIPPSCTPQFQAECHEALYSIWDLGYHINDLQVRAFDLKAKFIDIHTTLLATELLKANVNDLQSQVLDLGAIVTDVNAALGEIKDIAHDPVVKTRLAEKEKIEKESEKKRKLERRDAEDKLSPVVAVLLVIAMYIVYRTF